MELVHYYQIIDHIQLSEINNRRMKDHKWDLWVKNKYNNQDKTSYTNINKRIVTAKRSKKFYSQNYLNILSTPVPKKKDEDENKSSNEQRKKLTINLDIDIKNY